MVRCAKFSPAKARLLALLFPLIFVIGSLTAQQPTPAPDGSDPGYPVTIEGQEVLRIYEGIGTFTAQDRASATAERLKKLIYAPDADTAKITTADSAYGTSVILDENVLLIVTDDDAKHSHVSRELLAKYDAVQIRNAINLARQQHSKKFLIRAAIYAVATLAFYLLLLWLVIVVSRRLLKMLQPDAARIKGIKIQRSEIVAGERIARLLSGIVHLLRVVLVFLLTWVLLATEFNYFPWTREHGKQLLDYIFSPVKFVVNGFLNYLPNLFYIVVIVAAVYYLLKFVRVLAREFERGNIRISGFYPEWVQPTYKIVRFLLIAFTLVMIYPYLPGSASPAFKGVGLFIGVLFSLGSTSAVANVVAGVILTYTRGFRVGDWVKMGDNLGEVTSQTMLATHIRTIKNEEVIIPNSVILSSHVTNYSLLAQTNGLILHTSVTIGYDTPWRRVHELLIEAALKTEHILKQPAPFVLQKALDDSYVEYEINTYTDQPSHMVNIYSALHGNIQDCFYSGGVEIMSPIYSALRDGNRTAIPSEFLPANYRPSGFKIAKDDAGAAAGSRD